MNMIFQSVACPLIFLTVSLMSYIFDEIQFIIFKWLVSIVFCVLFKKSFYLYVEISFPYVFI